jgi:hypothetical protein
VIGHITAAVDPVDCNAAAGKLGRVPQQVLSLPAPSEGVCVGVLEEDEHRGVITGSDASGEVVLQLPGLGIGEEAKLENEAFRRHESSITSGKRY